MRKYDLASTDLRQYEALTPEEREAWLHPQERTYHSFHVERMGKDTYRWRDSRSATFYVGTSEELHQAILTIQCRKLDPDYSQRTTVLTLLSQEEVDDLFKDL